MKMFLIVVVMMAGQGKGEDLYVFEDPQFPDPMKCIQFVQENSIPLTLKMQTEYPGRIIREVYCVSKPKLSNLINGIPI